MRKAGVRTLLASVLLLLLAISFLFSHWPRGFLSLVISYDLALSSACVGLLGAVLWIAGWFIDWYAREEPEK